MFALVFYRYLKNYLTIRVSGGFNERFINLCNINHIYLWDMVYEDKGITAKLYCKDFYKLRDIRKKSGVTIKIINKNGLHYTLKKHNHRKGLLYGTAFALLFMFVMNFFVWSIETDGSQKLSDEEIISTVESLGLKTGAFVPLLDQSDLSRKAVNSFNGEVLWLAINIKGSKAVIEVRDYFKDSNNEEKQTPCNLLADFDGIIVQSQTYSGQGYASVGSAVKKGDLLISGISENEDGSVNYICSDGKYAALHDRVSSEKFSLSVPVVSMDSTTTYNTILFLNFKIPLSMSFFSSEYDKLSYEKKVEFDGNILPFGIIKTANIQEINESTKNVDLLYCIDRYTEKEYSDFGNTLIIDATYTIKAESSAFSVTGNYDCIDFIGIKSPIILEN